jgi:hypothetical protein
MKCQRIRSRTSLLGNKPRAAAMVFLSLIEAVTETKDYVLRARAKIT